MSNPADAGINLNYLANVRPSSRQLAWQRMEMYAFLHFGMNTMTDREWGLGHEDPALFNPRNVDVDQWMDALVAGGTPSPRRRGVKARATSFVRSASPPGVTD